MLEVDAINVFIGESEIIRNVSLNVKENERIGIIGPNGHGKSTTMKTIAGVYKPQKGRIFFNGQDIAGLQPRRVVEHGITLVPEGGHLFPEMSVYDNLLLGAYTAKAREHRDANLERVYGIFPKLSSLHKSKCNSLSGGELRMLAVGRGIMTYPKILILDEPTLGLAPNLVEDMGQKLYEIGRAGTSVILADENIDLMEQITERVYFIENGAIKLDGKTGDVLASEYVRKTYLGID